MPTLPQDTIESSLQFGNMALGETREKLAIHKANLSADETIEIELESHYFTVTTVVGHYQLVRPSPNPEPNPPYDPDLPFNHQTQGPSGFQRPYYEFIKEETIAGSAIVYVKAGQCVMITVTANMALTELGQVLGLLQINAPLNSLNMTIEISANNIGTLIQQKWFSLGGAKTIGNPIAGEVIDQDGYLSQTYDTGDKIIVYSDQTIAFYLTKEFIQFLQTTAKNTLTLENKTVAETLGQQIADSEVYSDQDTHPDGFKPPRYTRFENGVLIVRELNHQVLELYSVGPIYEKYGKYGYQFFNGFPTKNPYSVNESEPIEVAEFDGQIIYNRGWGVFSIQYHDPQALNFNLCEGVAQKVANYLNLQIPQETSSSTDAKPPIDDGKPHPTPKPPKKQITSGYPRSDLVESEFLLTQRFDNCVVRLIDRVHPNTGQRTRNAFFMGDAIAKIWNDFINKNNNPNDVAHYWENSLGYPISDQSDMPNDPHQVKKDKGYVLFEHGRISSTGSIVLQPPKK